ncbi:hypothetical protein U471_04450 [Bacillus amyloliquefaciens CC178]|nr:hypothetical protein U471_04450 [Bacillus amyloliquefaciens CC178]RAP07054.1 hypothetical protein HS9_01371 [Bacillus velezensis]
MFARTSPSAAPFPIFECLSVVFPGLSALLSPVLHVLSDFFVHSIPLWRFLFTPGRIFYPENIPLFNFLQILYIV